MSGVSIEARVHAAERYLSLLGEERRAALLALEQPLLPPLPDARGFARDAAAVHPLDPAAAVMLGEAALNAALRGPLRRYRTARAKRPVRLREEPQPLALQSIRAAVSTERNAPRREALLVAHGSCQAELTPRAREVVDALRDAFDALPTETRDALLPAVDDVDGLLALTEDLWRELDQRVLRSAELRPERVTWGDRLRSLAGASLVRELPPATWGALSVGWWSRIGCDGALRGVSDRLASSSPQAEGVYALVDAAQGRATLLGRPSPTAWDAAEVMGAGSVCAGAAGAKGLWAAHRRGVHREVDGALHALGRRLLHERTFLRRSAQLDGPARERVRVEALHAELARLRWDAVMGRFVRDVVLRAPSLGARFAESVTRAWGVAPPLSWAPHLVAEALEQGGPWGGCWGARARGARVESALRGMLRDRFDEDWHRNPQAGAWLSATLDGLRGGTTLGEDPRAALDAQVARLAEDYLRAH